MNLYPAGFNNLNKSLLPLAMQAAQVTVTQRFPNCKSILIIPESHTRNLMYWENVAILQIILQNAGFDARIGGLPDVFTETTHVETPSGKKLVITPLETKPAKKSETNHQRLYIKTNTGDFDPCIIWLNNDLSAGIPDVLQNIEQPICPSSELGWHQRLKSVHFNHYQQVAQEFASLIEIDPWLIDPLFQHCGKVDFMQREGEECLALNVEKLLTAIKLKYKKYNVEQEPFVVVKADSGTYGMSVMIVKNADEIRALNRKQRTKMSASKGSKAVHRVIMQEGVYTNEKWGKEHSSAEPVVYMIGQYVVGGFYRLHKGRSNQESLNAPGMHFEPLEFVKGCNNPDDNCSVDDCPNRFYVYGVIARLSMLAAAREGAVYNG